MRSPNTPTGSAGACTGGTPAAGERVRVDADAPLVAVAQTEIWNWHHDHANTLRGDSTAPVGLPDGWQTVREVTVPWKTDDDFDVTVDGQATLTLQSYQVRLARHPRGGWVLTIGVRPYLQEGVLHAHDRFEDLYTAMLGSVRYTERFPLSDPHGHVPATMTMVRDVLLDHLDETVPSEAADRVLIGLGADLRRAPLSLS